MRELVYFISNNFLYIFEAFFLLCAVIFFIIYIRMDNGKHSKIIKNNKRLKKIKRKAILWLIVTIIFLLALLNINTIYIGFLKVLGFVPFEEYLFFILLILVLISIYMITKNHKNYTLIYKNEIIHEIIKEYDSSIIYNQHLGIDEYDYLNGKFETYDKYYSEDLIMIKRQNYSYNLADIKTLKRYTDNKGRTHYSTVFKGSCSVVKLPKSVDANILILNNQIKIRTPISYVAIDNAEFEKEFDVHTDDKIMTMRILTPYITDKIMEFNEKTGIKMQFKIFNDKAYFRFYTKNLFEPSMFLTKFENKNIDEYIAILKYIDELMSLIIKEIDNLEI